MGDEYLEGLRSWMGLPADGLGVVDTAGLEFAVVVLVGLPLTAAMTAVREPPGEMPSNNETVRATTVRSVSRALPRSESPLPSRRVI
jgi:hypothetical protein